MNASLKILILLVVFFSSCQKHEWNNPFDPNCPKGIWTPTDFNAIQEGNTVKLSWSQPVNQISGFRIEKKVDNGQGSSLPDQSKGINQFIDNSLTGGKVHVYSLVAFAGENISNTVTAQITPILTADIITSAVSAITSNSATSGGSITSDGGSAITARGVCWSTSQNPTIADNKTSNGTGAGSFTSSLTGLTSGATYYIRAYATNSMGTAYGNQVTTTTTAALPTLTTTALSAITSTTATSGGNIPSDGGAAVTTRGVCWSTSQNPTIANSKTTDGTGSGSFTSSITGLTPGATYYIRAYATNSIGTAYGNQVTTTTITVLPTLTTTALSAITSTTATSGGNIASDGGAVVTVRGVCWSTSQNPTIANSKTTDGTGSGSFTSSITGLTPGATYYIRAYATNSIGTAYGNQVTTTTTTTTALPTLTTTALSAITATTATSGGNITSDGGAAVTARGVCWSTSQNPTIADSKTSNGTGAGSFNSSITGLAPGATYYIRAYATNSIGTAYGNQVTTTTALPTITTAALSAITSTTATSGGNIASDGGAAITSRGVCWSTATVPTTSNSKTTDGTGTGTFTSSITGLTPGTTYYVRAYATNSSDTGYGAEKSFITGTGANTTLSYPFSDNFESGLSNWITSGYDWSTTSITARSGSYSITDSPGGNYPANAEEVIILRGSINLSTAIKPVLTYWYKINLPDSSDDLYVEISRDGGSSWIQLYYYYSVTISTWTFEQFDLSSYKTNNIKIRFRLRADSDTTTGDGCYIDDVEIKENAETLGYPFFDDFENGLSNWITSGYDWSTTSITARSGSYSITDSPGENYPANAEEVIILRGSINLFTATNPVLTFWYKINLPDSSDDLYVEISRDGGSSWIQLYYYYSVTISTWTFEQFDLSSYKTNNIKIRFRLRADSDTTTGDGCYVDDVEIKEL